MTKLVSGDLTSDQAIRIILSDPEVQSFIQINRYKNVLWFSKENFEKFIKNLTIIGLLNTRSQNDLDNENVNERLILIYQNADQWIENAEKAQYQVDKFFETKQA